MLGFASVPPVFPSSCSWRAGSTNVHSVPGPCVPWGRSIVNNYLFCVGHVSLRDYRALPTGVVSRDSITGSNNLHRQVFYYEGLGQLHFPHLHRGTNRIFFRCNSARADGHAPPVSSPTDPDSPSECACQLGLSAGLGLDLFPFLLHLVSFTLVRGKQGPANPWNAIVPGCAASRHLRPRTCGETTHRDQRPYGYEQRPSPGGTPRSAIPAPLISSPSAGLRAMTQPPRQPDPSHCLDHERRPD